MYKVLIVEDDPMVAMINGRYVERNGRFCVAGECRDGQSAITFLEENPVDLVILDVYMPYMDGIETLHRIREKKFPVDVIMVTAANDKATLEETIHYGVLDYLVKPFDQERFQVALEKFASQARALQEAGVLNQQSVDNIIANHRKMPAEEVPKGIQPRTLRVLLEYLGTCENDWQTGEDIAFAVGLSAVTVRRYMNHLVKTGRVLGEMNYETGGRPSMLYKLAEK